MQQNLLNKINVSSRILISILVLFTLFVAKSLFLIIFLSILCFIVILLKEKSVNIYIKALKKIALMLLFFAIIYIIVFRDILSCLIFVYKIIVFVIFLVGLFEETKLNRLIDGIYTIVFPFVKKKANLDKIAYNVSLFIYFLLCLMNSDEEIQQIQKLRNYKRFNIKYYFLPRLIFAIDKMTKLETNLKFNYFKPKKEKSSLVSNFLLLFVLILFISVVFKEVIL